MLDMLNKLADVAKVAQETEPQPQQPQLTPPTPEQRLSIVIGQVIIENAKIGYEVECLRKGFLIEQGRANANEHRVAQLQAQLDAEVAKNAAAHATIKEMSRERDEFIRTHVVIPPAPMQDAAE